MMHKGADKAYDGSTRERGDQQDENLQAFDPSKPPDDKGKRFSRRRENKPTRISASENQRRIIRGRQDGRDVGCRTGVVVSDSGF